MEYKEREKHRANLEAEMNESSSQFFNTRPDLDIPYNVKMFDQGFERGFNIASKETRVLESKLEYAIEVMRTAQGLLKDGGQGSIVDTVWIDDKSNTTLWELLEMAIDED